MIAPAVTLVEKVLLARIYRIPILAGPFSTMPILQDVIWSNVQQCQCKKCQFHQCDLDPSDYGPANFSDANLDGANFTGASMNGVVLEYASQNGTNFTNAILSNALPGLYIKLSSFDAKSTHLQRSKTIVRVKRFASQLDLSMAVFADCKIGMLPTLPLNQGSFQTTSPKTCNNHYVSIYICCRWHHA